MKIFCINLGCPKNLTDTEAVLEQLVHAGHQIISTPKSAEVILINTCAFIQSATEESIDKILEMAKYKKTGRCKHLIVIGCLPSRYGKKLRRLLPEVDAFVDVNCLIQFLKNVTFSKPHDLRKHALKFPPRISELTLRPRSPALSWNPKERAGSMAARPNDGLLKAMGLINNTNRKPGQVTSTRHRSTVKLTPRHYAYVKIADGCDNRCKYCTLPLIRGPYHSRPLADILKEVKLLVKLGTKEIIYVAQDTTNYGADLYGRPALARLLKKTAKIKGLRWIRIMYAHPAHVTPGLIKIIGRTPKILKYLDLPLQHICDKILKKMGRRYLRLQVEKLIHDLRRLVPSIALRTTVMVGFPGESEKDFNELLEFITKYKFERLGVFKYSREEGTPANKMRGQVPEKVKESRFHQIMQRQNMIAKNFNRGLLNKIFEVLVDQGVAGGAVGRTYLDAPEIDGSVFIKNVRLHPGRLVKAKISGYSSYDLSARLVT